MITINPNNPPTKLQKEAPSLIYTSICENPNKLRVIPIKKCPIVIICLKLSLFSYLKSKPVSLL